MPRIISSLAARIGALLLFLFFLFLISLPNLVDLDNFRPQLLQLLRSEIAGEVEIGRISLTFRHGPGVKIDNVKIVDSHQKQHIAVDEAIVSFRFSSLLQRRLQVAGLVLVRPRVELSFLDPETFLAGFVKPAPPAEPVLAREKSPPAEPAPDADPLALGGGWHFSPKFSHAVIEIVDGGVVFTDSWTGFGPVITHLEDLDLSVKWYGTGAPAQFNLSSRVVNHGSAADGFLRIAGILASLHLPLDPGQIYLDCRVEARNLDGGNYFPYYSGYVPMRKIAGLVDIDATYQGNLMGLFHSRGRIVVRQAEFDYPEVFGQKLTAERLAVDCDFRLADHYNTIEIKDCVVDLDGFRVIGQCLLHDVRSYVDGKIDTSFRIPEFDPVAVGRWLPLAIFPEPLKRAYAQLTPGGRCQVPRAFLRCSYRELMSLAGDDPPSGIIGAELQAENLVFKVPELYPAKARLGGRLVFADTSLSCEEVNFVWGGATGRKCRGALEDLFGQPHFRLAGDLDLELATLWQQLLRLPAETRLQSSVDKEVAADTVPAFSLSDGRLVGRLALRGNLQQPEKLVCRGRLEATDAAFTLPGLLNPVTGFSGKFKLADSGLSLSEGRGRVGSLDFSCSGRTDTPERLFSDWEKGKLPIDFRISCPDITPSDLDNLEIVKEKFAIRGDAVDTSSLALHVAGDLFKPEAMKFEGRVDLDWSDLSLTGLPKTLNTCRVKARFDGQGFDCDKLVLKAGRSDLDFSGRLENLDSKPRLQGKLTATRLVVDDFLPAAETPEKPSWPQGLKLDLEAEIGELQLPSTDGFRPLGQDSGWQHLFDCRLSLRAGPQTGLDLRRCEWLWGNQKSSFSLTGKLDSFPDFKGELELKVADLDLDKLLHTSEVEMATQEEDEGSVSPPEENGRVTAFEDLTDVVEPNQVKTILSWKKWLAPHRIELKLGARHLVFQRMLIDQLSGEILLNQQGLAVERLDGRSFEGSIYVSGNWAFADDSFDLDIDLHRINLEKLNDFLDNPNRGFPMEGGRGSLVLTLDWQGVSLDEWRRNLDGLLEFNFQDGRMKRFTLVGNICSLLNVSQFASLKLPEFSRGVPYKTLSGRGTILSGVATVDDFALKGPSLNLLATGTVDFVNQKLDLDFGIQPLQTVDKLLASIPVVGYIMTGDKRTFVIIPVEVTGSFDDVRISTKSIKGLGEKAGDMIKRFFNTPIRLLGLSGKSSSRSGK
jgi:uncharacterized protein involved in outer membrane biogenesis